MGVISSKTDVPKAVQNNKIPPTTSDDVKNNKNRVLSFDELLKAFMEKKFYRIEIININPIVSNVDKKHVFMIIIHMIMVIVKKNC